MGRAERILIWGAGGHGKVLADLARACGHTIVGYADAVVERAGKAAEPGGGRIIATEDELVAAISSGGALPGGATALVLAVGENQVRRRHASMVSAELLPVLVHPSASVSPSVALGVGTVVLSGVVVNAAARIGAACILNTGAIVEHDCVIGDAVHVAPGAVLLGNVEVGDESWVGARAVVRPGLRIGADSMVGMGAVVIKHVADGVTVVGNPAREMGGGRGEVEGR